LKRVTQIHTSDQVVCSKNFANFARNKFEYTSSINHKEWPWLMHLPKILQCQMC